MQTTIESSLPHASAIAHTPPATQVWLYARDDQLRAALAKQARRDAASAVHAVHAAQNSKASSARLRAAVQAMATRHRLQLTAWTGSRYSRAVWLKKQIASAIELEGNCFGMDKPPGWRLIDEELEKTLPH